MNQLKLNEISKKELVGDYFWSNFMLQEETDTENYYSVCRGNKPIIIVRCIVINDVSIIIEFRVFCLWGVTNALKILLDKLKFEIKDLRQIVAYIVSEDRLGLYWLNKLDFSVNVRLREAVVVQGKKHDINILTYSYGE